MFKRIRKLLARIRHEIEEHTGAQWLEMDGEPAGVISRTEEEMEWIVGHIAPLVVGEPQLAWQRNTIYLRFGHRDFQKGSSLAEIARMHRLPPARCFAIGDSHNDLGDARSRARRHDRLPGEFGGGHPRADRRQRRTRHARAFTARA